MLKRKVSKAKKGKAPKRKLTAKVAAPSGRLSGKTSKQIIKDDAQLDLPMSAPIVARPGFWITVFDTETTGLTRNRTVRLDKQPEVIEFYGELINLDNGKVDRELDLLIRPTVEFPMTAYTIRETKTKLSNDLLADEKVFAEHADAIHDFLATAPGVLAHNLSFDKDMIEIELQRLGRTIEWPIIQLCTVEQTIHIRGRRMRLIQLHEYLFGTGFESAHRAKPDVQALSRIAVELRKRGIL